MLLTPGLLNGFLSEIVHERVIKSLNLLLTECRRLPGLDEEQLLAADSDMDAREPRESRPRGVAASTSDEPVKVDTWNGNGSMIGCLKYRDRGKLA